MNDRATMRRSRRGNGAQSTRTIQPQGNVTATLPQGARPFSSRVRSVMTQPQIPVTPAQTPVPRTGIRPQKDPVLGAIEAGFSGLQQSIDDLTRAIRQSSGLDEADEELEHLRQANRALQAQLEEALSGVYTEKPAEDAPQTTSAPSVVSADAPDGSSPAEPSDVPA